MANSKEVLLEGFLMKKKRDEKKSLLSSKYGKRWFELTPDYLAYTKEAGDIKLRRGVEAFEVEEMQYVKRSHKVKLEIRFPSRVLRLKAETAEDAEKWEVALQKANMMKVHKVPAAAGASPKPYKSAPGNGRNMQFTIEADSDDDDEDASMPPFKSRPGSRAMSSETRRVEPPPPPPPVPRAVRPPPLTPAFRFDQEQQNEQANKPPSPRSLLANPKMGSMMVSNSVRREEAVEERPRQWSAPDDDDEGYAVNGRAPAHRQQQERQQQQQAQERQRQPSQDRQQRQAHDPDEWQDDQHGSSPRRPQQREVKEPAERIMLESAPPPAQSNGLDGEARQRSRAPAERLVLEASASGGLGARHGGSAGSSPMRGSRGSSGADGESEVVTIASPLGRPPMPPQVRGAQGSLTHARSGPMSDDGARQGRMGARGPSPMGAAAGQGRPSPRGPSPAGSASAGRMSRDGSRPLSAATSGTGDDNWLGSDWDSSDEEQQQQRQRGKGRAAEPRAAAAAAVAEPRSPEQRQPPKQAARAAAAEEADDDKWDSDEEEEEEVVRKPASPVRQKVQERPAQRPAPAAAARAAAADEEEEEERLAQDNSNKQKGRFRRGPAAAAGPPAAAPGPARLAEEAGSSNKKPGRDGRDARGDAPEPTPASAGVHVDKNWLADDWDDEEDD